MKFNIGDTVRVVEAPLDLSEFIGKIGKVEKLFTELNPPIAYVLFEEDETVARSVGFKVPLAHLEKIEIQEETVTEISEGARKISRDEFRAAIETVTHPSNIFTENSGGMSAFVRGVTTMIVGDAVETAIFKDADGVVMTEDEFVSELWSACNPVALSEGVKKGMSASKCITVAITALIGLEDVVEILFGGSNG